MKITLVIDQFGDENNGTTISTRRFAQALAERGHDITVVAAAEGDRIATVPTRHVPIASAFAKKQGMVFAKADKTVLKRAIEGADVVHLLMPFKLERAALKIARRLDIPVTAAFHVQAENITSQIHMKESAFANRFIYKLFNIAFYRNVQHIHCPSAMIADELAGNGYGAKLYVISNGADKIFTRFPAERPRPLENRFVILSVGRLSPEKRHDLLIDAVARSRHADKIQLIIAGQGPLKEKLIQRGAKLSNPPIFGFYDKERLSEIINYSDLYVHPADIEIEAISCVEAFKCGLVPIIGNNAKCATKQFALSKYNLFECGDTSSLASRIDYWLDNPKERRAAADAYFAYGRQFSIESSIEKIEEMFADAIREHKNRLNLMREVLDEYSAAPTKKSVRKPAKR